jgi:hypothetical protein
MRQGERLEKFDTKYFDQWRNTSESRFAILKEIGVQKVAVVFYWCHFEPCQR